MGTLFNPEKIITRRDVPTFYCHGPRLVEVLDNNVRIWFCEDQPIRRSGCVPMSKPVAVMVTPLSCYVWNILAQAEFAFDHGILRIKPSGPVALSPPRILMS